MAAAGRHEEQVVLVVPGDLVHLEAELFVAHDLALSHVDERHEVLLVSDGDRLAVRRPRDVDVLAWRHKRRSGLEGGTAGARRRTSNIAFEFSQSEIQDIPVLGGRNLNFSCVSLTGNILYELE